MTERGYDDFDLEIKSLLRDAEEEVPPQIWEAVSSRVQHRRRAGAWWKWAGVAAAAAAAIAAVLTVGRPSVPASVSSSLLADNAVTAAEESTVAEETVVEEIVVDETPAPAARRPLKARPAATVRAVKEDSVPAEAETETAVETVPEAAPGTESVKTPSDTKTEPRSTTPEKKKASATVDPFALMAYEDAHKSSRRLEMDIKGLVGTNDNSTAGATGGRMASSGTKPAVSVARMAEEGESIYGVPVSVGAGVKVHFAPNWAVSAGLDYSLLWRTFKGTFTDPDARQFYSDNIKHSVQYIGLPVNLYYDFISSNYVNLYAYAGGAVEKGISDKYVIPGAAGTQTWKQDVPGLQWSAAAGLGVQFRLTDHMGLYADPGLRYYFDCGQPKSIRTQQPLMFSLELGFRFDL